jgi:putative lipoprotein
MNSLLRLAPAPLPLLLLVLGAIPMAASAGTVTGTAAYRERIALPPDAVLEVSLEDVSRADAPADLIGRATVDPAGQVPIPFSISYDPARIDPSHRYSVRARITRQGELLFTSTTFHPVLTHGAPSEVAVALQKVGQPPVPDRALGETYWKLTRLGATTVQVAANQREANLVIRPGKGQVAGSGGCNRFSGSCTVDGNALAFGNLASTRMACAGGMDQETAFLAALAKVRSWRISGDRLELLDAGGASLASFRAVDLK